MQRDRKPPWFDAHDLLAVIASFSICGFSAFLFVTCTR